MACAPSRPQTLREVGADELFGSMAGSDEEKLVALYCDDPARAREIPQVVARKDIRALNTPMRPAFGRRTLFVITKQIREIRTQLAETLQDQLGQQLAGTLLAAGALCAHLARRHAAEAREAEDLLDMHKNANKELNCLITKFDGGKLR